MTTKDIVDFIAQNSTMGCLAIDEADQLVEMPVIINYNEDGTANTELHTFRVSAISLIKEDITQKRQDAEAIIASL